MLIDPFITGNPAATVSANDFTPQTILLTHAHGDHVGDTVAIAKRAKAKVIATAELASWLGSQGVEGGWAANHGGTVHSRWIGQTDARLAHLVLFPRGPNRRPGRARRSDRAIRRQDDLLRG